MALDALIHRKRLTWWQRFQEAPRLTVAKTIYAQRLRVMTTRPSGEPTSSITIVCVSDTHNSQPILPPGDLLIHAGDMTQHGSVEELQGQLDWLNAQPHLHKVVIAGNHDIVLDKKKSAELGLAPWARQSLCWGAITYLEHSSVALKFPGGRSLVVHGHPSTRKHGNWAFQFDAGVDSFTNEVCDDADILVTHSAPRFHLDIAGWGDQFLLRELWRVNPKLHVFGHLHEGYGRDVLVYDHFEHLYERVCAGNAGISALFKMMLLLLFQVFLTNPGGEAKRSILVNASAVGSLLDREGRKAQVVRL